MSSTPTRTSFALFDGFTEFVDFFHFQDLVTPDYDEVLFYLPFDNFKRPGTPATTEEYVTYREATLEFIAKRRQRIAKWLKDNDPDAGLRRLGSLAGLPRTAPAP